MEPLSTFRVDKSLEVAKDKRTSRRGQLTKTKPKLAEFKSKELDSIPPYAVQTCLAKLKKDIHLHEAIQRSCWRRAKPSLMLSLRRRTQQPKPTKST